MRDSNNEYVFTFTHFSVGDYTVFDGMYDVSHQKIIDIAGSIDIKHRGDDEKLFAAIVLSLFILLDMVFPNLFFLMRHGLSVENPVPSDSYRGFQRLAWVCYPLIIIIILFIAVL